LFYLKIFHKSEKTYFISNILFKLSSLPFLDTIDIFNAFHLDTDTEFVYTVIIIELSINFKKHLKNDYIKNHHF